MKRIRRAVAARRRTPSNATDSVVQLAVPRHDLTVLANDLGAPPRKSGTLLKYTNVLKGWKPRYFTLDNGLLLYSSPCSDDPTTDDTDDNHSSSPPSPPSALANDPDRRFLLPRKVLRQRRRRLLKRANSKEHHHHHHHHSHHHHQQHHQDHDRDRDVKGAINVQNAVVSPDDSDECRFAIDTGSDVFHCKADSQQKRDEWVHDLNHSIHYFTGIVQRAVSRAKESSASSILPHPQNPRLNHDDAPSSSHSLSHLPIPTTHSSSHHSPPPPVSPHSVSDDSDESVVEDDGLRESERSRRALLAELSRVLAFWRRQWIDSSSTPLASHHDLLDTLFHTFSDKPPSASNASAPASPTAANQVPDVRPAHTAKGLVDLLSWCLLVLQTNDDVFHRRANADLTRIMADGLPVFPPRSPDRSLPPPHANGIPLADEHHPDLVFSNDDDSDAEFVDALSRAVSKRSSFTQSTSKLSTALPPVRTILPAASVPSEIGEDDPKLVTDNALTHPAHFRRISTAALSKGYKGPRQRLPPLTGSRERLNIFGILKDAVGKDLSKITLPVGLNEPLSFVQRLAEDIEYCELLDMAAEEDDPNRRMLYVATMVISHYSSTQGRVGKPFNPLLGETACLIRPDKGKGVRFISEQVSHHPPISACYAEGTGGSWKYYNAIEVRNKFWGKSLEVFPTGLNHIEIPKYGDHYVLEQITSCVHNIVVGRMWLDNYGDMEIVNRTNGGRCVIEFSKTGWMSDAKSFGAIKGKVYNPDGDVAIKLGGNWTTNVWEDLGRGKKKEIWKVDERPPEGASQSYNMTRWAITLNAEVGEEERRMLPPTDSRLRPDQRALELGQVDFGSRIKQALEEGQRKRRKDMEMDGKSWEPLWFEKVTDEETGRTDYRFNDMFFKEQSKGDWPMCPDIFTCANSVMP